MHPTKSGRGAAKWFGIVLAAIVVILVLFGIFGGASLWGPGEVETEVEEVE